MFLLLFAGFAALQSVPLPASLVNSIAPGTAAAFEEWLPRASGEAPPTAYSLSVAPGLSRDFAARAVVVAAFAFVAVVVFANPQLATILLGALAVTAALHASLGIYQRMTVPGDTLGGIHLGQPFGFFVNRNNAAGLLNAGLAGAVGLAAWRICRSACPTSTLELSERRLGTSRPTYDQLLIFAIVCGVIAVAGIIASGSRGALVGSAAGFIACLLVAVPAGRFLGFGIAAVLVFVAATYSLTSLGLESEAMERLSETMDEPVLHDGRLDHWPDAVRAAVAYLPLGSGMGSYRYAHLPYQQSTYGPWFANADNQWLEWWVEGGLVAVLLIIAAVVVVGIAIRRLLTSLDPIDRGMAAAGAYGLFAILVSQLFDFALLISPIAIATTLLLSAVVARAAMVSGEKQDTEKPQVPEPTSTQASNEARLAAASRKIHELPRSPEPTAPAAAPGQSPSSLAPSEKRVRERGAKSTAPAISSLAPLGERVRERGTQPTALASGRRIPLTILLQTALGLTLLLCLLWAQPVTSAAAHSQAAVFASQAARGSSILSLQPLTEAEARLSERLEVDPDDYAVLLERTAVRVQLFRLYEAAKAIGTSRETYQAAYDHSRLKERRKAFYEAAGPLAPSEARLSEGPLTRLPERNGVSGPEPTALAAGSSAPSGERVRVSGPEPTALAAGSSAPSGERVRVRGPEPTALAAGNRPPKAGGRPPDAPISYLHAAAADARAALRSSPLSPEPRIWLARLDFITGEVELTETRLEQIAQLRSGSLVTLDRVIDLAVQSHHWGIARDALKQSIALSTARVPVALARVRSETPLRASDVVPDERAAILAAAEFELRHPDPDPEILAAAQQHLTPALSDKERALKEKVAASR